MTAAASIAGGLLAGSALLLALFTLGFRTKFAPLQAAIRRFNRDVTNPRQLQRAGQPGSWASVIHHVGRTTGRPYRTPIVALPTESGFLFALPYGPRADWVRNVLAAGSATLDHNGETTQLARPNLVPADEANHLLPRTQQQIHRIYGVQDFLLAKQTDSPPSSQRPTRGADSSGHAADQKAADDHAGITRQTSLRSLAAGIPEASGARWRSSRH